MTPEWLNRALDQVVLPVWQSSQAAVVAMWFAGLPVAFVPLWQLAHVPVVAAWLNRTDVHDVETWQSSQTFVVVR
ncbi:MAG: hypothetical protein IV086_03900 [Hyphomonadaceae bacterium]|nr:hypothetical protein [Hyphomonadaceae bacterium]